MLEHDRWTVKAVSWSPLAYIVKKQGNTRIAALPVFTNGFLYLQSLASMLPALVLNPQKGERILDACAAPGSKTTQMAAIMENTGTIVANDISPIRLAKLKANCRIQGITNVVTSQEPAQNLSMKYTQYFDKVLVDAPCTGTGVHDNWSEDYIASFPERQKAILRTAIACTKPGGTIVYSTCTISPDENEGVIEKILKEGNVQNIPVEIPNFTFDSPGRVNPTTDYEGFFVAKLRKFK